MMTRTLIALLAPIWLCGCAFQPSTEQRVRPHHAKWGKENAGLQLGIFNDSDNPLVHCYIRNASTTNISYCEFDFGYWENVDVQMLVGTNWISVQRSDPGRAFSSAMSGKTLIVGSHEILKATSWLRYEQRPTGLDAGDTFIVDLRNCTLPVGVNNLHLRVIQNFRAPQTSQIERLVSPEISVESPHPKR